VLKEDGAVPFEVFAELDIVDAGDEQSEQLAPALERLLSNILAIEFEEIERNERDLPIDRSRCSFMKSAIAPSLSQTASPSTVADSPGRCSRAATIRGYHFVQSMPLRVRSLTASPRLAIIR
jgi:hypothetical protein